MTHKIHKFPSNQPKGLPVFHGFQEFRYRFAWSLSP